MSLMTKVLISAQTNLIVVFAACLALFVSAPLSSSAQSKTVTGKNGAVVCVSKPGSEVGLAILKKGGNAVDAAVATAFAMAVTFPQAGNIGGGGFMMVHPPKGGKPVLIDYREVAPLAATRDMFAGEKDLHNHRVVGVPGTVRGMALAHQRFGKLPWKTLVLPAVRLARRGFILDKFVAGTLNQYLKVTKDFPEFQRVFGKPDGSKWKAGDRLVQPDLAKTFTLIAEHGPDAFYTGKIADQLVAEMKSGGGLITHKDLTKYQAIAREPIHGVYRGYDVYGPPPPSSGGICLVQMLNVLEEFDLNSFGRYSPKTMHIMIEAMRRAFYDRARFLGDPAFTKIPARLTLQSYAKELAESISLTKATPSEALAKDIPLAGEGDSTTHFSIIDKDGLAVSNTYTLEHSYGSRIVVKEAGFLLNNEMGDFNWKPGYTDRKGRIGTKPNLVGPGKKMLSSQTPTIVAKNGKVVLVTGSPGGRTIINTVLCMVVNVIEFKMDLPSAMKAPRHHHQWFPDEVRFEGIKQHPALLKELQQMGHRVSGIVQGDAHSILVDAQTGTYRGVADYRRSGSAAGY